MSRLIELFWKLGRLDIELFSDLLKKWKWDAECISVSCDSFGFLITDLSDWYRRSEKSFGKKHQKT